MVNIAVLAALVSYINKAVSDHIMKQLILIVLVFTLLAGCGAEIEEVNETSKCDSYSEGPRKIMCYAMEAEDITMCDEVVGRFRDNCFTAVAEIQYDTSLVDECDKLDVEANAKICRGLMAENINKCFEWEQGEGMSATLSARDCIDLTARKLRSTDACKIFETRATELFAICGDTSDCEGQWITGASDHASDCEYAVQEAIDWDAENS